MTCTLRGKNDVQVTVDDSYIFYVNQIDLFQNNFVLVFYK